MSINWPDILRTLSATTNAGASPSEVARFERSAGVQVPAAIRDLLLLADGALVDNPYFEILSLEKMQEYVPAMSQGPGETLGYLTLLDDNQSNPICVCTRGPLDGYVVRVNHDDDSEVTFRSVAGLFKAIEAASGEEDASLDDIELEIGADRVNRTADDERRGRELLQVADQLDRGSDERMWLIVLAMQLLSVKSIDVIETYLEDVWFVRRTAKETLAAMRCPEADRALSLAAREMLIFRREVESALQDAGLSVEPAHGPAGPTKETPLIVNPGRVALNVEVWFSDRHDPTTIETIIAKAKQWSNERTGSSDPHRGT